MTSRFLPAALLALAVAQRGTAQQPRPPILSGYLADVSGATIDYHSPHPEAESALLARARRDVSTVAWQTDTVPASVGDTAQFVWLAGVAGSMGLHRFDFLIDGARALSFPSITDPTVRDWSVTGAGGASLEFRHTMVDQFNDVFGYMTLRVPRVLLTPGRPLTLSVVGEDAGANTWYMTFRHRLSAHPRIIQDPVLVQGPAGPEAQVRVIVDGLSAARTVTVAAAGHASIAAPLDVGGTVVRTLAGAPDAGGVRVVVRLDSSVALDTVIAPAPVAQRDVYLLPYSHNDIGYSDLQPAVERKQWRNIEDALRAIDRTRDYPADERQHWDVEILWPVRSWLAQAAAGQRQRFFEAVRRGDIGLNAFYANVLSGLATAEEMDHYFDYARELRERDSLPITTALIDDIPGQSWGIVDALAGAGVHAFAMGPNCCDRIGHVLEDWGDRPFLWVSASGRDTVLTWIAGASYSAFHSGRLAAIGEQRLFHLMRRLDTMGYAYRQVQLPYTIGGDNGVLDTALSDVVRDWNARYVSPHLVISTHARMFRDFLASPHPSLPVVRGDFTGYWEDGAMSSALETVLARRAASRLTQAEAVWRAVAPSGMPREDFAAAWRAVTMWDEHTWGAAASVDNPEAPEVEPQWRYKQAFALGADSMSRALLTAALARRGAAVAGAFDVINTSDWPRTDLVLVPAELSRAGDRVLDAHGRAVPSQRLSSGELAVLVRGVPARGFARFRVRRGAAARPISTAHATGLALDNGLLSVRLDSATGAIAGLVPHGGADLVDRTHRPGLGAYLYVAGTDSAAAAGPARVRVRVVEPGPLVAVLRVDADAPGARSVAQDVRLVAGLDRVDLTTTIDKLRVRAKEAVHLAFPFAVPGGLARYDVAGAVVRADSDQIRGANRNYESVVSYADVSNPGAGVTLATPDAPLVEIGGMWAELPWMRSIPASGTIYAYLMNNYWHTNYRAWQEGPVTFRFGIAPHAAFDAAAASRFGAEQREPLIVAPAAGRQRN